MAQAPQASSAARPRSKVGFPVVALLMLLVASFIGYRAATFDVNVVRCGADVMRPSDTCLSTDSGGGTYAEVQAIQQRNHRVDLVVALGSGLVAGVLLARWLVRRIMGGDATADPAPPGSRPGAP